MLLSAPKKIGKTWTTMEFARALAAGGPVAGSDVLVVPDACNVLYLDNELGVHTMLDRCARYDAGSALDGTGRFMVWSMPPITFDDDTQLGHLKTVIKRLKTNVLVVDPINTFTAASVTDPGASQAFVRQINQLLRWTADLEMSVICVLHDNKPPGGPAAAGFDPLDWRNSSCAGVWGAWADTMLKLAPDDINPGKPGVDIGQRGRWTLRHGPQPDDFALRIEFARTPPVYVMPTSAAPGEPHRFQAKL